MPNTVASNCLTSLVEDIDDDNNNWWDTNETACQTNPLSSSSVPVDTDGDWLCNFVDTDDDNDGWSDVDETMCEPRNAWSSFATGSSTHSWSRPRYNYPTDLIFDNHGLRMVGTPQAASYGYPTLWSYTDPANLGNNQDYTTIYSTSSQYWSSSGELELYDGYAYSSQRYGVYKSEVTPTSFGSSTHFMSASTGNSYDTDMTISSNGIVYVNDNNHIDWKDQDGNSGTIQYPSGATSPYAQIEIDSNGNLHFIAYSSSLGGIHPWTYDGSSWSAGGGKITATGGSARGGSQNAAYAAGGATPTVVTCGEEYNGSSWASTGNLITARVNFRQNLGTQNSGLVVGGSTPTIVSCVEGYDGTA